MSAIQGSDAGCGQTPGTAILAVASAAGLYVSSTVLEPAPTPTASTSFLDKISFQTGVIPAGTYRIEWSYRWNQQQGSGSARTIARVQVDGVNIGDPNTNFAMEVSPRDTGGGDEPTGSGSGSDQAFSGGGWEYVVLTAADHLVELQVRSSGSTLVTMWDSTVFLLQVA